jgi:hypothetical protein
MKKIAIVLFSVSALYALEKDIVDQEYPDQNAMVKPLPVEHAPAVKNQDLEQKVSREAEKMYDKFNDYMHSEENKAIVDAVLYAGNIVWQRARAVFHDGKEVKYGNVSLALALATGYVLGRRFSGIGKMRKQITELTGKVDTLPSKQSQEMSTQIAALQAHNTKQYLELQRNIAEWMMKSKGGPTAS